MVVLLLYPIRSCSFPIVVSVHRWRQQQQEQGQWVLRRIATTTRSNTTTAATAATTTTIIRGIVPSPPPQQDRNDECYSNYHATTHKISSRSSFPSLQQRSMSSSSSFSSPSADVAVLTLIPLIPQPPPPPTIIYILGAGSIGLLFAAMLRCTYPSYPIQLLLRPNTSLLLLQSQQSQPPFAISNNTSSTTNNNKKNIIHVCLQQTFPIAQSVSTTTTTTTTTIAAAASADATSTTTAAGGNNPSNLIPRRLVRSRSSPRIVLVPYEMIPIFNETTMIRRQQQSRRRHPPSSCIFLTTKAYQALEAIQSIHSDRLFVPQQSLPEEEHNESTIRIPPPSPMSIIVFCNGALAVVELIQDYLMEQQKQQSSNTNNNISTTIPPRIYYGITTHGAYREKQPPQQKYVAAIDDNDTDEMAMCHVVHAGNGTITILPTVVHDTDDDDVVHSTDATVIESIVSVLQTSGLNCSTTIKTSNYVAVAESSSVPSSLLLIWKKLAANCIINPLTVIHHCSSNGALLCQVPNFESDYLYPLCHEIAQVYVATTGTTTTDTTTTNSSRKEEAEEVDQITTILCEYVVQVIHDTAKNRSSMYEDVYNNCRINSNDDDNMTHHHVIQTEIDYFNGYIIDKSKQYQLECPINRRVLQDFHQTVHKLML